MKPNSRRGVLASLYSMGRSGDGARREAVSGVPSRASAIRSLAALGLAAAFPVSADLTYEGCPELTPADFQLTKVASGGRNVFEMAIASDGKVFFVSMGSGLSVYDPATGATTALTTSLRSLFGVALDPAFAENGWIYLYHTNRGQELSQLFRVTYDAGAVKVGHETPLLSWEIENNADHDGGSMRFDFEGNLWLTTGDNNLWQDLYGAVNETKVNYNSLRTAGNTNHLSGKVLRIRPLPVPDGQTPAPGPGSTYAVPAGNFAEHYQSAMGWTAADLEKVRPEIYAMGFRNPFSLNIDYNTGLILEGELGPQATRASTDKGPIGGDELNIFKKPGFYGWPMFTGPNLPYNQFDYGANKAGPWFDVAAPKNTSSFNTGVETLPPPVPALLFIDKDMKLLHWRNGEVVEEDGDFLNPNRDPEQSLMAGPIVKYQAASTAQTKLPPHLHGRWIVSDYYYGGIYAAELDSALETVVGFDMLVETDKFAQGMDLEIGPDGTLYVAGNSGAISRLEYTGDCVGTELALRPRHRRGAGSERFIGLSGWVNARPAVLRTGRFRVFTLDGRALGEISNAGWSGPAMNGPEAGLLLFEKVVD